MKCSLYAHIHVAIELETTYKDQLAKPQGFRLVITLKEELSTGPALHMHRASDITQQRVGLLQC